MAWNGDGSRMKKLGLAIARSRSSPVHYRSDASSVVDIHSRSRTIAEELVLVSSTNDNECPFALRLVLGSCSRAPFLAPLPFDFVQSRLQTLVHESSSQPIVLAVV